jgi:hypothetical protein
MKPNIVHYDLLMKVTFNKSLAFQEMEQSSLNYVYNRTGAIPWTKYDEKYNWGFNFPGKKSVERVVAYHFKAWEEDTENKFGNLTTIWRNQYIEMQSNFIRPSISSNSLVIEVTNESEIKVKGLKLILYNEAEKVHGNLYIMFSTKLTFNPTLQQVKEFAIENDIVVPVSTNSNIDFVVNKFSPNKAYRVFYFVQLPTKYNISTDIYYIDTARTIYDYNMILLLLFTTVLIFILIRRQITIRFRNEKVARVF